MMNKLFFRFLFAILLLCGSRFAVAGAGISSAHPLATQAGMQMLEMGGNAFDAAVAVTAALAVVEPTGSGLGGGGFWLLHDATTGKNLMLDGREKAPLAATRDMYLDDRGEVIEGLSVDGALAAGIPGEPAALAWLARHYGLLPLSVSLGPAIELAQKGFSVNEHFHRMMTFRLDTVRQSPAAADIFLRDNEVPPVGVTIVQTDLASTLKKIASEGRDGFYRGEVAQMLVAGVRDAGGIWTLQDLEGYRVKVRKPVSAEFRGMKITSAAPPSSGGLVLAIALNILAGYDLESMDEAGMTHVVAEAMRRAYRDRAEYMGDSDFVDVPMALLADPQYAAGLRQGIRLDRATPSEWLAPTREESARGTDTTHFSVIDAQGNRVAATLSINYPFGSGMVPAGTGVLLNDEMDDFSSKPGSPNVYGLVGAEANAIEGGKRMLSSMSPTFLETGERIAVIGTPGGSRIISMVLLGALEFFRGATADEIVNRPRFHHQYLPDRIQYESGALSQPAVAALEALGHEMKSRDRTWGNMHVVIKDRRTGKITAAADGRGSGEAMVTD